MRLLVLGFGYTAERFVAGYGHRFSRIDGTVRNPEKAARLRNSGLDVHLLGGPSHAPGLLSAVAAATHVLVSVPPGEHGDPALYRLGSALESAGSLRWIGYLSTTAVYGDQAGAWVDETTVASAPSARGQARLAAESGWHALGERLGIAVQIFRLTGIYGPGRNALVDLAARRARRLDKAGQMFNRVHVDDIAAALNAAVDRPGCGPVFNLADDLPAPQPDVIAFAAALMGLEPPPLVPVAEAALSPMAASFWSESKRVANGRAKAQLDWKPLYPTYREGLTALRDAGANGNK